MTSTPEERSRALDREAQRAAVADDLERTLEATLARRPAPTPPLLSDQLILPQRTMRLSGGIFVDDIASDLASDAPRFGPLLEGAWGLRSFLELSLPVGATLHGRLGPVDVGLGVNPLLTPLFSPLKNPWSARFLASAILSTPALGLAAQGEVTPTTAPIEATLPPLDPTPAPAPVSGRFALRGGLLLRPTSWLLLHPAVEWRFVDDVAIDNQLQRTLNTRSGQRLRIGGVLQRGFVDTPLVEVQIVSGFALFGSWVADVAVDNDGGFVDVHHRTTGGVIFRL